jgi:pyruvate,orthophosphate dikinase
VVHGVAPLLEPEIVDEFEELLKIADGIRKLGVRANGDNPEDARNAIKFGAEGIGLCRTEHMFMASERLPAVQEMIMATCPSERAAALAKIEPMQETDFYEMFKVMNGLPLTIRLLDPPLHEFLPGIVELNVKVALLRKEIEGGATEKQEELEHLEQVLVQVERLHEANPMMGLRGCRLGLTFPEINEMQVRAIFNAAIRVAKEGIPVKPEIMIPLVGFAGELRVSKKQLQKIAEDLVAKAGVPIDYKFGTMIEVPRGALVAAQIAEDAEFFSFGTNDLTQMTLGFSRDDSAGFISTYTDLGILETNPFETLDRDGPGKLLAMAVEEGRRTRPTLKCGICGEHGGDPNSIEFCHMKGLNYVSCSPFRVVTARVAAAQAQLKYPRD